MRPASRRPTTTAEDTLFSGKIGLLYKLTDQGNVYVSYGTTKTPPGTANFTLQLQAEQPEQPERRPAGVDATSRSAASGTSTAAGCR